MHGLRKESSAGGSEHVLFGVILPATAAGLEFQDVLLPPSSDRDKSEAGRTFVPAGQASLHRTGSPCSLLLPPRWFRSRKRKKTPKRFCCEFVTAQTSTLRWLCLRVTPAWKRGDGQSAKGPTLRADVLSPSMTSSFDTRSDQISLRLTLT